MLGFINHAYASNTCPVDRDGDTVYIALRPIQAGEQLSVNYYGFHWDGTGKYGYKDCNHHCDHALCEYRPPTTREIESIIMQPEFQYISSHHQHAKFDEETMDGNTFYTLKNMCVTVLRKFGRMFWCPQLQFISDIYAKLLIIEFNGTMAVRKPTDEHEQLKNNNV